MIQLRLTKKIQHAIGLMPSDLQTIVESDHFLGNWYANIFLLYRKTHLIFMNEMTLFSFPVLDVKKADLQNFAALFKAGLQQALVRDGLSEAQFYKVMEGLDPIGLTSTNSRKTLGNMTDLVHHYRWHMQDSPVIENIDIESIQRHANYMPQRNLDWEYSGDFLRVILNKIF